MALLGDPDESRISQIACSMYPDNEMEAYTIAKDFRESDDPAAAVSYSELPELIR